VSTLDWIIVAFAALLGLRGFRVGFVAEAFSLAGALAGLYLGSRLASSLLSGGLPLAYGTLIPLLAVIVSVLLGQALARTVGERLRLPLLGTPLEPLDKLGGVVLGVAVGLMLAWVVGILGQQAPLPPTLQAALQQSEVVKELDERLPSRALLQAFSRLDPLPQIEGPRPEVPAPDPELLEEPGVRQAAPSVVRIVGASGLAGRAGSGWAAAPGLVVTNAHVVADVDHVAVQPEGVGAQLEAEVLVLDERNDLAVLRVEDLNLPALKLAVPKPGEPVAVLGYPENGPFDVQAGRVGGTQRVLTSDIRGRRPVERQVTTLRSSVRQGNSGGPAVNSDGRVVATIFAERAGEEGIAYGIPSPIVEEAVAEAQEQLSPAATAG
jgi:S1-C subfamily serine protease